MRWMRHMYAKQRFVYYVTVVFLGLQSLLQDEQEETDDLTLGEVEHPTTCIAKQQQREANEEETGRSNTPPRERQVAIHGKAQPADAV